MTLPVTWYTNEAYIRFLSFCAGKQCSYIEDYI